MSPPPVRIRVGASLDASVAQTFRTAAQLGAQAETALQRQKKKTTSEAEKEAKQQLRAQQALTRAVEALDRQRSRGLFQQFRAQEAAAQRAAKAQESATARAHAAERREIERTSRAAARALRQEMAERSREAKRAYMGNASAGESFARRTSHRTSRFLMPEAPIGPMVMRGLRDVSAGLGIDFSVQGMVGRNVELERVATDLSNSGYQAGAAGPNGQRVDPRTLMAQARGIGGQFGIDANEVLSGLVQYQKIAGDLDTGRQNLYQMAALAKATGTNLGEMAAATANVSNGLGDIPNKAAVIDDVMRTIAGQGKLGAVEISDMAVQMARIAAAASNFSGDRSTNIKQFGALAQIARAEGGAPSAAEAARSMGGFANTLKKGARIKAFAKEGIDVFTDDTKTQLKDPIELIKASLLATGGDLQRMNALFMDVVGARTVFGLQKTFTGAGGGQTGIEAVDKQIGRMMRAQMSKDEVKESAEKASNTDAARAAKFQNKLDQVSQGVMAKLVPALERAEPAILKFAETIGNVTTWAVENPKTAIAAAISMSLARAGLETVLRSGIERLLLGQVGAAGVGSRAAALGSMAGKIGAAGTIAALAVTTLTVGMAYIDQLFDESQRKQREAVEKDLAGSAADIAARQALGQGDLEGAKRKAEEAVKTKQEAMVQTQDALGPGTGGKLLEGALTLGGLIDIEAFKSRDKVLERATAQQQKELSASRQLLERIALAIENQPPDAGGGDSRDSQ